MTPADVRKRCTRELYHFDSKLYEAALALAGVMEAGDYMWGFGGSPMSIEFAQARDEFKAALARVEALKP